MRGRKPRPSYLKLLRGNAGEPRGDMVQASEACAKPTCPAHLSPTAKAEWRRIAHQLHEVGLLTVLDRAAFAGYCQAYGRWVEAERKLAETPALLKLPSGYVQANPWLGVANKQLELMQRYMAELGLSAVARTRVEVRHPHQRSKFDKLLTKPRKWTPADEFLGAR
jgi:P27 family predicted phage terminase small subunit